MGKNHILIITTFLIAILVSGAACNPLKKQEKKTTDDLSSKDISNIRQGTDGLTMEFVKNVPPDQVYDTEQLTVMLNLKNKGAENIEDAWFFIGGVDPGIVDFGEASRRGIRIDDLEAAIGYIPGKDELRGEEGEAILTFNAILNGLPPGTDVYEPNIVVTTCYNYRTIASPIVCIDPNPFGVYTASKACQPKTVTATGQGGPIAITKIEQVPSRGKVQFKIYVENKGKGKAISDEKYPECTVIDPQDYKYINKIDSYTATGDKGYNIEASGLSLVRCQPDPENLRLIDDKAVIVCSFDIQPSGTPAYTTPLKIELGYNYMESTQPKKVKIIKI